MKGILEMNKYLRNGTRNYYIIIGLFGIPNYFDFLFLYGKLIICYRYITCHLNYLNKFKIEDSVCPLYYLYFQVTCRHVAEFSFLVQNIEHNKMLKYQCYLFFRHDFIIKISKFKMPQNY